MKQPRKAAAAVAAAGLGFVGLVAAASYGFADEGGPAEGPAPVKLPAPTDACVVRAVGDLARDAPAEELADSDAGAIEKEKGRALGRLDEAKKSPKPKARRGPDEEVAVAEAHLDALAKAKRKTSSGDVTLWESAAADGQSKPRY